MKLRLYHYHYFLQTNIVQKERKHSLFFMFTTGYFSGFPTTTEFPIIYLHVYMLCMYAITIKIDDALSDHHNTIISNQPVQNQSFPSCIFLSPYFSARKYSHGIIVLFYLHHHHSHMKPAHKQFSSSKSQFYLYAKKTLLSLFNINHHNPIVSFLLIPISFFCITVMCLHNFLSGSICFSW